MKKQVKAHLNSLFKLVIQLSVAEFGTLVNTFFATIGIFV